MKSILKIFNMHTSEDVSKIKAAITNNEGVVACQINKEKGEVNVVFDDYFITTENLVECLEDLGYSID